jgi:hypothetical protein
MDDIDKRLFTYRDLIVHGERCANYVVRGIRGGVFTCLGWTAMIVGLYLYFSAEYFGSLDKD